jgi:hypothetical protein
MHPDDLDSALELLRQAADALAELPVDALPDELKARLVGASVRVESIMLSLQLIEEALRSPSRSH